MTESVQMGKTHKQTRTESQQILLMIDRCSFNGFMSACVCSAISFLIKSYSKVRLDGWDFNDENFYIL